MTAKQPLRSSPQQVATPTPADNARSLMLSDAAKRTGIVQADYKHLETYPGMIAQSICRMINRGLLLRGYVKGQPYRYFTQECDMLAWIASVPDHVYVRPVREKSLVIHITRAPRRPVNAPHANAAVVENDKTRRSSSLMPDRWAVDVPFRKIGEPGWSMTV